MHFVDIVEFVWLNGYLCQLCEGDERDLSILQVPEIKYAIKKLLCIKIYSNMVSDSDCIFHFLRFSFRGNKKLLDK